MASSSSGSRMIKVKVKTMEPATHEVTLQNQESISDLKDKLVPVVHAPKERLRLIFHGRALGDDQETLEHAGIRDEDTVHLVVRPPDAPPPPSPSAGGVGGRGAASSGPSVPPGGGGAAAAGGGQGGGPEEVPHMLATFAAYLQRLQSSDFNPTPVPISSLGLGTPLEEVLVALTESIQNILQGVYLPSHLQALLDTSMTDPAGLLPTAPSTSSAPAAFGQPTTTTFTSNNQGTTTTTTTTTSSSSSTSTSASPAPGARAPATTRTRAGAATPASARSNTDGRGANRAGTNPPPPRPQYRYTPLAVAALAELLRRVDTHFVANLQPQMRELATTLLAATPASSRLNTQQANIRSLASNLHASAALLTELARIASAVSCASAGNIMALANNTASVIQPDGSAPSFLPLVPRPASMPPSMFLEDGSMPPMMTGPPNLEAILAGIGMPTGVMGMSMDAPPFPTAPTGGGNSDGHAMSARDTSTAAPGSGSGWDAATQERGSGGGGAGGGGGARARGREREGGAGGGGAREADASGRPGIQAMPGLPPGIQAMLGPMFSQMGMPMGQGDGRMPQGITVELGDMSDLSQLGPTLQQIIGGALSGAIPSPSPPTTDSGKRFRSEEDLQVAGPLVSHISFDGRDSNLGAALQIMGPLVSRISSDVSSVVSSRLHQHLTNSSSERQTGEPQSAEGIATAAGDIVNQVLGNMLSSTMASMMAHQGALEEALQGVDEHTNPGDMARQVMDIVASITRASGSEGGGGEDAEHRTAPDSTRPAMRQSRASTDEGPPPLLQSDDSEEMADAQDHEGSGDAEDKEDEEEEEEDEEEDEDEQTDSEDEERQRPRKARKPSFEERSGEEASPAHASAAAAKSAAEGAEGAEGVGMPAAGVCRPHFSRFSLKRTSHKKLVR
ncbi:hypothetical protein DUNSADRAFT_6196, partial [Dunaliella salina]